MIDHTDDEHLPKCLVIAVYFGRLPSYFSLFVHSIASNPGVDFLLVTDQQVEARPSNLKLMEMTLEEFRHKCDASLGMQVCIPRPYKVCDFRPAFGHIFEAEIAGYTHWGHCDLDVIFGNILGVIPLRVFASYPKILVRGCFALYRNTPEVNSLYSVPLPDVDYRRVFTTPNPFHFDESAGILRILESEGIPVWNENCIFNIAWEYYRMRATDSAPGFHSYVWRNGRVLEYAAGRPGEEPREAILIHLMKRPMKSPEFDVRTVNEFVVGPNAFAIPGTRRAGNLAKVSHSSMLWLGLQHQLRRVRRRFSKRGDLRPLA